MMYKQKKHMNKNIYDLQSFTSYCNDNPEQRFWQALRNWNAEKNKGENFILVADSSYDHNLGETYLGIKDTFYRE